MKTSSSITGEAIMNLRPTNAQYGSFQIAYDFFNVELFDGKLPDIMFTMNRKPNSRGYFHANKFGKRLASTKTGKNTAHELCLNPDTFQGRTDAEIMSTLVHEMCHVWQYAFGKPSRGGYHNKEWGAKMLSCGLQPVSADRATAGQDTDGGTHQSTHRILKGGLFDKLATTLLQDGFHLNWQSMLDTVPLKPPVGIDGTLKNKSQGTRAKFTCPTCGLNAWAKPGASLVCGDCQENMVQ